MKTIKQTIKKYSFWTGLSASVVMLAGSIAKLFGLEINNQLIEDIIMSVCSVLVTFGVVCIPKEKQDSKTSQDVDTKTTNNAEQNDIKNTDF